MGGLIIALLVISFASCDSSGGNDSASAVDYEILDNGTWLVYNATGLQAWADYVNDGNWSTNCTLGDNISLSGKWTTIGIDNFGYTTYTGTFDGNNKTISALSISESNMYVGFFRYIGEGGTVKNLTLNAPQVTSSNEVLTYCGIIAASNRGTIENCTVSSGIVTKSETGYVGGIVGYNYGSIKNCTVYGGSVTINGTRGYAAGIAGANGDGTVDGCNNSATVNGGGAAGGIVGYLSAGTVTGCTNSGIVTSDIPGGIVGYKIGGTVESNNNTGSPTTDIGYGS